MSEEATVAETVEDSVEAIRQSLEDQEFELDADADDLGRKAYGRKLGSRMGREVGGVVGRELGRVIVRSARQRDDSRAVLSDVRQFLVTVAREVLRDAVAEASFSEIRERVTEAAPTDALGIGADDAGDGASADSVSEASEAADQATDDAAQSVDDLNSLREETLRELLDVMSYTELQSIAKEIDVKANLDRETMTEEIVTAFVDDSESGDADASSEGSDGSDDDGESSD